MSARPTNAATDFMQKILHNRYRGDGGDINNLMVIIYSKMLVELTGSVIFGSFVMGGRVERSLHMWWWYFLAVVIL